ncbi:hypothetical protein [Orenia metallireducens]|nr:hypothetical protein [Orenia metallireducens]
MKGIQFRPNEKRTQGEYTTEEPLEIELLKRLEQSTDEISLKPYDKEEYDKWKEQQIKEHHDKVNRTTEEDKFWDKFIGQLKM